MTVVRTSAPQTHNRWLRFIAATLVGILLFGGVAMRADGAVALLQACARQDLARAVWPAGTGAGTIEF
ncbi:MAG: hypothetical protein CMQ49_11740 [Gammaproteobacteria bacterium]|nr:hypothetical protein [Gammaproteobacteria bacterium]